MCDKCESCGNDHWEKEEKEKIFDSVKLVLENQNSMQSDIKNLTSRVSTIEGRLSNGLGNIIREFPNLVASVALNKSAIEKEQENEKEKKKKKSEDEDVFRRKSDKKKDRIYKFAIGIIMLFIGGVFTSILWPWLIAIFNGGMP